MTYDNGRKIGLGYKIAAVSLGCAKNLVDTETMLGLVQTAGHEITTCAEEADVILVNTCGFIGDAKQESIDTILQMTRHKQDGKCRALIVTGCLAERYHSEILAQMPEVDAVAGTGDFVKIVSVIDRVMLGDRVELYGHADAHLPEGLARVTSTAPHTAYLKIADGCDNRCTYCVIPALRGPYRSRHMADILNEAAALVKAGVRELILIAQDTTRYGIDIYGEERLSELVARLCEQPDLRWLRLHYCYPEAISDQLLDVMAANPKVCRYLDIPIQHANDEILKRMGRKTDKRRLEALISQIRKKMPDSVLRTSVIVGFPGETQAQFEELLDFVRKCRFDRLGAFAYSKEEGTAAAKLSGHLPKAVKMRRHKQLMTLAQQISLMKNSEKIGTAIEVLCEGYDAESYLYYGRSRADSPGIDGLVYFAAPREVSAGEFVTVKILCAEQYDITGEMIQA